MYKSSTKRKEQKKSGTEERKKEKEIEMNNQWDLIKEEKKNKWKVV